MNNFILSEKTNVAKNEIEKLSLIDELTKISNRRMISTYLNKTWEDKNLRHKSLSVIMFDIDFFKKLNDTYGHNKGDECLCMIASTAQELSDKYGFKLARYGGEEFIMAAYDMDHENAVSAAEELRIKILDMKIPNDNSPVCPFVTVSLGVSTQAVARAQNYVTIIEWADECLYFAKRAGRNRVSHREEKRQNYNLREKASEQRKFINDAPPIIHESRYLKDFHDDFAFIFYKQRGEISFSRFAVDLFDLPEIVQSPIVENIKSLTDIPDEDFESFTQKLKRCLERKAPLLTAELRIRDKNGNLIWLVLNAKCIYTWENELDVIYGTAINIERLDYYQKYMDAKISCNPITGLPNRQRFRYDITQLYENKEYSGLILIFDISDFRSINGFHGHTVGNEVLSHIAETIDKYSEKGENLYHYGADQFIVLCSTCNVERAQVLTEKIFNEYHDKETRIQDKDIEIKLTAVSFPINMEKSDIEFLVDIDIAIQMAKKNHREEFSIFTEKQRTDFLKNVFLQNDLQKAVHENFRGFFMEYQPIIDAVDNRCAGPKHYFVGKIKTVIQFHP